MTLWIDIPPTPDSTLSRLDPRWKLAALIPAALGCTLFRHLGPAAIALACACSLAFLARIPPRWFFARLATVGLLLLLFMAVLPFLVTGPGAVWQLGPLRVSEHGLRAAFLICLKALAIVSFVLVMLSTSSFGALLKAAHSLRVPGLLVQLIGLTHRYVIILADELARLRIALRVRGYRARATSHSYRTIGHVAGTLLVRGYERAERVGQAMRCRGFDGRFRALAEFRTTALDIGFFAGTLGCLTGLLGWDLLLP